MSYAIDASLLFFALQNSVVFYELPFFFIIVFRLSLSSKIYLFQYYHISFLYMSMFLLSAICYVNINLLLLKVWDREKIVIIPDHYIFTSDERANRNVDILRDFCMEQNIKYFYDIKDLGNFKV